MYICPNKRTIMIAVKEKQRVCDYETYNFKITNKSNEAKLLIAYLAALPYVEMTEVEDEPSGALSCPYSMEEVNARLDIAERQAAAGLSIDNDEVFRRIKEKFAAEEYELNATI